MSDAPTPHNIEAEQAVLGALLLNNDAFDRISGVLDSTHFFDPVHCRIYELAADWIRKGQVASPVSLKPYLADDDGLKALGGSEYLLRLAEATISIVSVPDYARQIRELSLRRDMIAVADQLATQAANPDPENDADDIIAEAETILADLSHQGATRKTVITLSEALNDAATRMQAAYQSETPPGIDLGIPELSEKLGRALPGELILLAGRPSMGKSAVLMEMARRTAETGVGVVYWCGEMAPEDNAERAMSAVAKLAGVKVPYSDARRGRMDDTQFRALLEAGRKIEGLPLVFIEPSIKNISRLAHEIRREVRKFHARGLPSLVVIDYIQQITTTSKNRFETVSEISQEIKSLAIDLRVPVVAASQLSRKVEDREIKRPQLSDLRESGQLEQDANTVLFLFRDEYYLERKAQAEDDPAKKSEWISLQHKAAGLLEIIIAKQRSGPIDTVKVRFDGATNSISGMEAGTGEFEGFDV